MMAGRRKQPGSITDDKRGASYLAHEEPLNKNPPGPSFIEFQAAMMAYYERNDIDLLVDFVRSDRPLSRAIRCVLAGVIELLHVRSRPRREGTPGGKVMRWQNPNYVIAFLAEKRIDAWKVANGRNNAPAKITLEIVKDTIEEAKSWSMMRGKRSVKSERILALLREPKNRRL